MSSELTHLRLPDLTGITFIGGIMRTVVMTGGSSGFGRITLKTLTGSRDIRVISGARTPSPDNLFLDLSNLESVRTFADTVVDKLNGAGIDILILNAGLQTDGRQISSDGFELTFAVNYLAHFLLINILLPHMNAGSRIVMTASGTYDPAEKTIIPPPLHANATYLAYPQNDPQRDSDLSVTGGRAYSSSKLCVMLMARRLHGDEVLKQRGIKVTAYDPGAIPGTGLVRHNKVLIRVIWKILGLPLLWRVFPGSNSVRSAGSALADLARGKVPINEDFFYAALRRGKFTFPELSDLAKRDDLAHELWRESHRLCNSFIS